MKHLEDIFQYFFKTGILWLLIFLSSCDISTEMKLTPMQEERLKQEFVEQKTGKSMYELRQKTRKGYKRDLRNCIGETYGFINYCDYGCPEFEIIETFRNSSDFVANSSISLYMDDYKQFAEDLKNIKNFTIRFACWKTKESNNQNIGVLFFLFSGEFFAVSVNKLDE